MTVSIYLIILLLFSAVNLHAEPVRQQFAISVAPSPVFNSPLFEEIFGGVDGNSLKTDNCGQIRELEFIALTGTVFSIQKEVPGRTSTLYRVTTSDYPYKTPGGLFLDSRFVRTVDSPPEPRQKKLPSQEQILSRLRSSQEIRYVWGGNVGKGVQELLDRYPPANPSQLTKDLKESWQLAGLDCSGLLYEATGGWTPRNTSSLVTFGEPVDVKGLSADAIAGKLRPLDLIVWPGHVLIALDHGEVIESRLHCDGQNSGVVVSPAHEKLREIMRTRKPSNQILNTGDAAKKTFVLRRWVASETQTTVE